MKKRRLNEAASSPRSRQRAPNDDHRETASDRRRERGTILGLRSFEKISAVEGIRLSKEMRADLLSFDMRDMNEGQRSRFIVDKYGKA